MTTKSKRKKTIKKDSERTVFKGLSSNDFLEILKNVGLVGTKKYEDKWLELAEQNAVLKQGVELFTVASDMSPKIAVTASFMSISAMTRRDQYVTIAQANMRLNLWALVIGTSGWARKTTAEKILTKVVRQTGAPFIPANFTPQAFFKYLQKQPQGLIVKDEMSTLIKSFRKEYNADLPEVLSEIYESKDVVERITISRGLERLEKPYVVWWGGSAPHFIRLLKDDDWHQGFMHRWVYCVDVDLENKKYNPLVLSPAKIDEQIKPFVDTLKKIRKTPVTVFIPEEKTKKFKRLEEESVEKAKKYYKEDIYDVAHPYFARVPATALKLAGLLQFADYGVIGSKLKELVITADNIDLAVEFMNLYVKEFETLVALYKKSAQSTPPTTERRNLGYFLEVLRGMGGVATQPDLIKELGFSWHKYKSLLDTLVEAGAVMVARPRANELKEKKIDFKGAPPFFVWDTGMFEVLEDALDEWWRLRNDKK